MKTSKFKINVNKVRLLLTGLFLSLTSLWLFSQTIATPDGFAAYAGTTGGGNASPITVSSASEFISAVSGSGSAVIYVNGFLNVGNVSIGSNKTIVGKSETSGIGGGKVSVNGSNYIFQNLIFGPGSEDVMEISGGSKVFITKCTFHDAGDEILSIVREADFVTVSWCKFYFNNSHDHAFGHLIGNSDDRTSDRGKLNTTMHHNWYAQGVVGRMPRVRFGKVHIYNNYYNSTGNDYCIGIGKECHIRLENTHFDNVSDPWADYGGSSDGEIGWSNLKFEGCSQPGFMPNSYPVFSPPYSYSLDNVNDVESIVKSGAGNVFGGSSNNPPSVSITSPSNGATFNEPASITISATASDSDGSVTKVEFFQGSTSLGSDYSSPYSVSWNNVSAGNYSLTAVATDNNGASSTSSTVNIVVSGGSSNNPPSVSITAPSNGASFSEPANITISATASDSDGSVAKVEFFQGSTSLGVDYSSPYSVSWNNVSAGNYSLKAIATDNDGASTTSSTISIVVTGSSGGDCDNPISISLPFSKNGSGEFCWKTSDEISTINSWNLVKLFINGVDYTNTWSNSMPAKQDGYYYIEYIGNYDWSHFEASSVKSAESLTDNTEMDLLYYPNPVDELLNIHFANDFNESVEIQLVDIAGKVLQSINTTSNKYVLDMSSYPEGLYVLKVFGDHINTYKNIVKQ